MTSKKIFLVRQGSKPDGLDGSPLIDYKSVALTPEELTSLKILLDVELKEVEKLPCGQEPYYTILKALLKKLEAL